MVSRVVLGCGSVAYGLIQRTQDRPGALHVVTDDEGRVEALRAENVPAECADPADPAVLAGLDTEPGVVFVGGDDPERNREIARAARERFPEATLVAYAGREAPRDVREALSAVADHVVDPEGAVARSVVDDVASEGGVRARRLRRTIRRIDGRLAVVMHDNPDPDAIASAVALARIAESLGTPADACYYGEISHQENRAFVNLLELSLVELGEDPDLSEYAGFALVDHSRPGVNDQLPEDTRIDVVVDHHPPRAPVEAGFADLRSDVGATSTMLTDYLERFRVPLDATIATALLYGIRVDTKDFSREVATVDFEAAATLLPYVDMGVLERVESPSVGVETLDIVARAIVRRDVRGSVLVSGVGEIGDRDALAQAADKLLEMEGVATTLVFGIKEGTIFISARARGAELDLGETLRAAFDQIGSAGGHADMAGAQIPMGVIGELDDDEESLGAVVRDLIADRFFDAIQERPVEVGPTFGDESGLSFVVSRDVDGE